MTIRVSKPTIDLRSKLSELEKPIGLKGNDLMKAETAQDARDFISAGRKNLVINGDARVAQKGTSADTGSSLIAKSVDMFKLMSNNTDTNSSQQSTSSTDEPWKYGFRKYLRVTNGTITYAASSWRELDMPIEAQDVANSGWVISDGNSYATLSFWVRSSVSQKFFMYLRCVDGTMKSYTFGFETIANQWVKVEHTIPGDPSLTVNNDTGLGFLIRFVVHYGSSYTGSSCTEEVWRVTGSDYTPDSSNKWAETSGATFDVTGVQLEVGKNATDFEQRSYAEELALCQRYYFETTNAQGTVYEASNVTTNVGLNVSFPVQMRAIPTITLPTSIGNNVHNFGGGDNSYTNGGNYGTNVDGARFYLNNGSISRTVGTFSVLNSNAPVKFSAEL